MRIAVAQMTCGIDPVENVNSLVRAIEQAARGGAVMLFTPEMSNIIDGDTIRSRPKLNSQSDDQGLLRLRQACAQYALWVQIGSMAFLQSHGSEQRVNRSLVIDNIGTIRAHYDKMHLFDVNLATGEQWRESATYVRGDRAVVAQTPLGLLGLSICYDVRFPALYQAHSAAGATTLAIPAAFTVSTGKAHWHILMRARAIENAAWVICAAQTGSHDDGRSTYGHSLVISPSGDVVLDMGTEAGLGFAEIDSNAIVETRQRVPVIVHRRTIPAADIAP